MRYRSTRGGSGDLRFLDAVMTGLAPDGGLLVPADIPDVSGEMHAWRDLDYAALAQQVMSRFIDDVADDVLADLLARSYGTFNDDAVTPLVPVADFHVLELFHGPTLAFKDVALQFLGNVFAHVLAERGGELNILGATSGDTGSAAIAGVMGKPGIRIFIMFPDGRTSPVQELQMTTVMADNVYNLAVSGSFDDCQKLLKDTFSDLDFKAMHHLGAVNSVNWARVLAQVVYYFSAWNQLGQPETFDVAVPTGNFGNIFAGFLAREMGLPIGRLILATNSNDILARFFSSGRYARGDVHYTTSPAMDIQVSSNFERYLYFRLARDTDKVRDFMTRFQETGAAELPFNTRNFDEAFRTGTADDAETIATIRHYWEAENYLVDPHTAVGINVAKAHRRDGVPLVCLSTAHPAKFEDVVSRALPDVEVSHPTLAALEGLPTRKHPVPNDLVTVKAFISENC